MKIYKNNLDNRQLKEEMKKDGMTVAVYGLGKMGLPLAAVYADVFEDVIGVDIDQDVVETVSSGGCHVQKEPGLPELVESTVSQEFLTATTDAEQAASESTVHVVIVPTLVNDEGEVDLSSLESVLDSISNGIETGDLVVIESTVPPRTSADLVEPVIAKKADIESGDFGVAFCPERTSTGRAIQDIRGAYPKVIGGIDEESTQAAEAIYQVIVDNDVITVSDATTAETVKVLEGVYRDVNIALANELAGFVEELGIDMMEAIEVANTNPFCEIHRPGAGVGGHCIPYYPYFLIQKFDTPSQLMETAREINDSMPSFAVNNLIKGLNKKSIPLSEANVVVLGVTYRPGVDEIRHSPALDIVDRLTGQGAEVYVVDPIVDKFTEFEGSQSLEIDEIYDVSLDAIILVTAHEEFESMDYSRFENSLVVVDGRQAIEADLSEHWVYTIGEGLNEDSS